MILFRGACMRLLAAVFLLLVAGHAWAAGGVHLILSEAGGAYAETEASFRDALGDGRQVKTWVLDTLTSADLQVLSEQDQLLVPVGMKAARALAAQYSGRADVLVLLLPRSAAAELAWRVPVPDLAYLYLDQPPARSVHLIRAALPQARRVGVLLSDENSELAAAIESAASSQGMTAMIRLLRGGEALGPALREVLEDSDVLLLVPDARALPPSHLSVVLLAAYRQRVPTVGFSPAQVKSGAVLGVFSSPGHIGRQGAALTKRWMQAGRLPESQSAASFAVDINSNVARSLGLALPSVSELAQRIGAHLP